MFKIESYVTPILVSYVEKYVREFRAGDAVVSLWGGGVALHNLELRGDVLQRDLALPFTLLSGRIHELTIHVPWTKIMSEPIVVTVDTIECILSLNPGVRSNEETAPDEPPSARAAEAPPGYMQALVRRVVSNIALRVHHLIVKYAHDDIVLSLNVKHLAVDSAGPDWRPAFADIEASEPVVRRVVTVDDLTLCLDRSDADGKIRFYQEPLLYRCRLDIRFWVRLACARSRRAVGAGVRLASARLAWGASAEQVALLLRLLRERSAPLDPPAPPRLASTATQSSLPEGAEPARSESWSEWAWSWLPAWTENEGAPDAPPAPPGPLPLHFTAYFDDVNFTFKVMETEGGRRRARPVLELRAWHAAMSAYACRPVEMRVRVGARALRLASAGKCVCGFADSSAYEEEPTVYVRGCEEEVESWAWPPDADLSSEGAPPHEALSEDPPAEAREEGERLWGALRPQLCVDYRHERSPSVPFVDPFANPPLDFQYSDWVEERIVKVTLKPVEVRVCMGLIHRIEAVVDIVKHLPPVQPLEWSRRVLTVEECEALSDNLPQWRVFAEAEGVVANVVPWAHSEHAAPPPVALELHLPRATLHLAGPLYPHRVCSAASQLPEDAGPLWQGARVHVTLAVAGARVSLVAPAVKAHKPCARADIRAVAHILLFKHMFAERESVELGYSVQISEASVSGSLARLQAAHEVLASLYRRRASAPLRTTSLAADALHDDNSVMLDVTLEELVLRGYFTRHVVTHLLTLQAVKAINIHQPKRGEARQAFLFSAPDSPRAAACARAALQWCRAPLPLGVEYAAVWTEPAAVALDPLFTAFLMYAPDLHGYESFSQVRLKSSSVHYKRRRVTPPSSSGRGASRSGGSAAERGVHAPLPRPLLTPLLTPPQQHTEQWSAERVAALHSRLRRAFLNVELGLVVVYVPLTSVSALNCDTIRDAMERHAANSQPVLVLSLGRLLVFSSTVKKQFWQEMNHEGPTFARQTPGAAAVESFPWRARLADVACYTLEVTSSTDRYGRDSARAGGALKTALLAKPQTILELVSSTLTLSVVTKTHQIKPKPEPYKPTVDRGTPQDEKTKYFKSGMSFRATTLKEFLRGPIAAKKPPNSEQREAAEAEAAAAVAAGPVVSLGVNVHADTPPLALRFDKDQVHVTAAVVHAMSHLAERCTALCGSTPRGFARSRSEMETGVEGTEEETLSEHRSAELVSIFEAESATDVPIPMKTFFWFQWVLSGVRVSVPAGQIRLTCEMDDIITTVDLQPHYDQFKLKVASAALKYQQRSCAGGEWEWGALGGRLLEARDPHRATDDNHFIALTVTRAQISNLPASWREELHPKLLEENAMCVWEVYATVAPLEAVLQPQVVSQLVSPVGAVRCPHEKPARPECAGGVRRRWPLCYVTAGGLRVLLTPHTPPLSTTPTYQEDCFVFQIGKSVISPHPENPICRRAAGGGGTETSWVAASGGFEGRQYELLVRHVSLSTARFAIILQTEGAGSDMRFGTSAENPALKWSQKVIAPDHTPVLHRVEVGCVWAPALWVRGALACGPALDLNLLTDCALELSVEQLALAYRTYVDFTTPADVDDDWMLYEELIAAGCPLAYLADEKLGPDRSERLLAVDETDQAFKGWCKSASDSGAGTEASVATGPEDSRSATTLFGLRKAVSVADHLPIEYLEVYVTMGAVEVSLYAVDDHGAELAVLKHPSHTDQQESSSMPVKEPDSTEGSRSSDIKSALEVPAGCVVNNPMELPVLCGMARERPGNVPLVHVVLYQPNLYYWKNETTTSVQVSLFNAWAGLGGGEEGSPLVRTARGAVDPVTEIPPALATLKLLVPTTGSSKGDIRLDVERPVMFHVGLDTLQKLNTIYKLMKSKIQAQRVNSEVSEKGEEVPFLYRVRRAFVRGAIESVRVQTSQVGVCGEDGESGAAGWDSASVQVAAGARPDRLVVRALFTAVTAAAGHGQGDARHVLLQPLTAGAEAEVRWEVWHGGEPVVRAALHLDCLTMDLRPTDLAVLLRTLPHLLPSPPPEPPASPTEPTPPPSPPLPLADDTRSSSGSVHHSDEHYYKDDLRSGAFKVVGGGQLPMAYQVRVQGGAVTWRYPHPRAITRLLAFPLPGQNERIPCVLELYDPLLDQWDKHTDFEIPVSEPSEVVLYTAPPEAVFGAMWRYRVRDTVDHDPPYQFDMERFRPRTDPLASEHPPDPPAPHTVTAEELSGVVRVDSYFAPHLVPRLHLATRVANLLLYLHNAPPPRISQACPLEGYYVSKPLTVCHRVVCVAARDSTLHARLASPAGALLLAHTHISCDVLECSTGTMERLVCEVGVRVGVSVPRGAMWRVRGAASRVHAALHVPRLRTLHSLARDWTRALHAQEEADSVSAVQTALEGRVAMWVHNDTTSVLRVGQDGTDEVLPLPPDAWLAYRWRSPTAEHKLRFALAGPQANWRWSNSIPWECGVQRVRLKGSEEGGARAYLVARVERVGARTHMTLSARLALANMLRHNLHCKVRARCRDSRDWHTVCYTELPAEALGGTVVSEADCEMALKIKFATEDVGWSGDIPLKECPKENVPWLVKVPRSGAYTAVWCRVVRGRDGRLLAALWPLYVLHSDLPHDVDVLIATEGEAGAPGAPVLVSAAGRGACTHLPAPGTTATRHRLLFQYRDVECPVTRESVPLHYGVTESSVFSSGAAAGSVEEVIADLELWLARRGRRARSAWPHSTVAEHWTGVWRPAALQPHCDLHVEYCAVSVGGAGCALEVRLRPALLLCNAAPLALTLRAHDAAPLCRLEPGGAVALPSALLTKSFFLSMEVGRETFSSGALTVCAAELGRYAAPPPGTLAPGTPAHIAIYCNNRAALLSVYYEVKEEMHLLGITATYTVFNRMGRDIRVATIAVPDDAKHKVSVIPTEYITLQPTDSQSVQGVPVCLWRVAGRWRGADPRELRLYLCAALPDAPAADRPLPVRIARTPYRRPFTMIDNNHASIAAVAVQVGEAGRGRWAVSVAPDPCPQYIVHNRTPFTLALGQPATHAGQAVEESEGALWHARVEPGAVRHYSTPAHSHRYPPAEHAPPYKPAPPTLTFAKAYEEEWEPAWCAAVSAAAGERLLTLHFNTAVKLRVRAHPHTTHLELTMAAEHDISASDIRNRLGAFSSCATVPVSPTNPSDRLERVSADVKLLKSSATSSCAPKQGVARRDAGVEQSDADAERHDAGAEQTDAGAERHDAGAEQTDAGAERHDAGAEQTDAGAERHDDGAGPSAQLVDTDVHPQVYEGGVGGRRGSPSTLLLYTDEDGSIEGKLDMKNESNVSIGASHVFKQVTEPGWEECRERVRVVVSSVVVEVAPLAALHMHRAALLLRADRVTSQVSISIGEVQVDNPQYESGQYDFGVIATTRASGPGPVEPEPPPPPPPPLCTMFVEDIAPVPGPEEAHVLLTVVVESWTEHEYSFKEVCEVEVRVGPVAVFVEDAYVRAACAEWRRACPPAPATPHQLLEERALVAPLRLRSLHLHPLHITLTLHTAMRMYIALDGSWLRLNAFRLQDAMTSVERLTHALTVHYLSAAIFGAGWVVGGLELLGAPGALAARVGGARGGVRGVATAAAAALVRSLSACAGSLARNLDLLAGDEEHARRAAAARRRPPPSLAAGLVAGLTNFAVNILGAVGGLAHHPLVDVALGEGAGGAAALRRGLVGALAKPLSATADLVAYAGHGLLAQTGWDPAPQPRSTVCAAEDAECAAGWRRDCVRWAFRLAEGGALAGYRVLLDDTPNHLLITHRFLVVAEPESERIVEMIDLKYCSIEPYQGQIIEVHVSQSQRRGSRVAPHEEEEQVAMARVARWYTGASGGEGGEGEGRTLALLPAPGCSHALHAALTAAIHNNNDSHLQLL